MKEEINRLNQENSRLNSKELNNFREETFSTNKDSPEIEELQKKIDEYENFMIIEELKQENVVSDLKNSIKSLSEQNTQGKKLITEYENKIEILEKKVKESLSSYTKFLIRKNFENKESQTIKEMITETSNGIEVQRNCDMMNLDSCQISRMSITESELFDVTGIHLFEIFHQNTINIPAVTQNIQSFYQCIFNSSHTQSLEVNSHYNNIEPARIPEILGMHTEHIAHIPSDRERVSDSSKLLEVRACSIDIIPTGKRINLIMHLENALTIIASRALDQMPKELTINYQGFDYIENKTLT